MRLLNTTTKSLRDFPQGEIPAYAILSHTWGDNEVLPSDVASGLSVGKESYWRKIDGACKQATADGLGWLWVDTLCLQVDDIPELDLAVNSAFRRCRDASVCYAYLCDVPSSKARGSSGEGKEKGDDDDDAREEETEDPELPGSAFRRSRWFSRGWTLLEMLTPREVRYYSSSWGYLGSSGTPLDVVAREAAGIIGPRLSESREELLQSASVANVMSWASGRRTTRPEDRAYSLLGMLKVSMPIRYGDGGEEAFLMLQRRIIERGDDHSVLAWGYRGEDCSAGEDEASSCGGALARSPSDFAGCGNLYPCQAWKSNGPSLVEWTDEGLRMKLPVVILTSDISTNPQSTLYAILNCCVDRNPSRLIAIPLRIDAFHDSGWIYERDGAPTVVSVEALSSATIREIHLRSSDRPSAAPEDESRAAASFCFRIASDMPQTIIGLRPTWKPQIRRCGQYQHLLINKPPRTRYIDSRGPRWVRSVIRLGRGHVDFDQEDWMRQTVFPPSLVLVLDYAAAVRLRVPPAHRSDKAVQEDLVLGPAARCYVAKDTPGFWDSIWRDPNLASYFRGDRRVTVGGRVIQASVARREGSNAEDFVVNISSRAVTDMSKAVPTPHAERYKLANSVLRSLWPVIGLAAGIKLAGFLGLSPTEVKYVVIPVAIAGLVVVAFMLFSAAKTAYDAYRAHIDRYEPARRYMEVLAKEWAFPMEAEEFRPAHLASA